MITNKLKINDSKTEFIVFRSPQLRCDLVPYLTDFTSDLKILDLDHQLQVQLSSLMWDYDHDTLPTSLNPYFKRVNLVHNYSTMSATIGNLYYSKVYTSK